ncbi:MAG: enoyl-CoA hydratase [Amycolatopsis sp.]|jgi:enoyl-CoA hydratase|uniref:crotonase/enoyl-CoA hydratase family protein n=1 Tax=Amycolatopsis sp. TaxID=37632 RepID=UPI00261BD47C|nr:crotonase/enoyl-CoA hydratase family protein [Amycolatopsis sp.]MCU1682810.1 enoyl-CoA hydratase [Amycolatopsis sp.]
MPQVLTEQDGHVLTVTLNRPARRNALTISSLSRLADIWSEAAADTSVRVVVLTGAEGSFCAGMDLRGMAGEDGDEDAAAAERAKTDRGFANRGLLKTGRMNKPVIAAVEGNAIAGGMELLLGTDIRVAGEGARFGLSEVRWALYPAGGGVVRLSRQIPYPVAVDIMLTGRHIDTTEAAQLGLIGHIVPDGKSLETARQIAATIAANGPLAVEAVVRTLRETAAMSEEEAFAFEQPHIAAVFGSEDAQEGPRAFAEKRTPVFHGR